MRGDWKTRKFGEVTKLQGGNQPPKKTFIYKPKEGYVRLLQIRDFKSDDKAVYIPESDKNRMCTEDDILIGRYGASVGNICTGKAGAHNVALIKATPDPQILERRYYLYYLKSHFFQGPLMSVSSRSAQNGFNKGDLENFKIPIPPLPEQKRIVAMLDEAFEAIDQARANIERNIKNAEELFQSKLNDIFSQRGEGWDEKPLGDLTYVKSGGTPRRSTKEYWENGSIPWYSSGELNEIFTTDSEDLITEKGLDESNAKLFPKGSLLIGMYDTAALKMSILDRDGTFNQAISGVKPNEHLNLQYVRHAINAIKPEIMKQRRGVRQKNLNLTKIKAIPIPFPKIEVQNEVVAHLNELQNYTGTLIESYQNKLEDLNELKKSILQKAFSGELTANEHVAA